MIKIQCTANGLDVFGVFRKLAEVPDQADAPVVILHATVDDPLKRGEIETFKHRLDGARVVVLASPSIISHISAETIDTVEAAITDEISAVSLIGILTAVQDGFKILPPTEFRSTHSAHLAHSSIFAEGKETAARLSNQNCALSKTEKSKFPEADALSGEANVPQPRKPDIGLSARELAVIRKLRDGASNKDIAKKLNIVENTVKVHLRSCYRKIGVKNRTQAAVWASQNLTDLNT